MLCVGAILGLSNMWVWRAPLFITGQILNGIGLLIGLITLVRFLKRPRDLQGSRQQPESRWPGYESYRMGEQNPRDYQDLRESRRRGMYRRKM